MFDAAIASAQPALCIPPHLPSAPRGRLIVIGAGKASAAMARSVEQHWAGPLSGLVVTRYGYAVPCEHIEIAESAHPVPDAAGLRAAQRMMELVKGLNADDLVLCLISGGGSALLPLPAAGLTLDLKQTVNRALLASGATISEVNCVRRHLSDIKGGRLAAACHPAQVLTLLISDVPGDRPVDIASGPTVADPTTCADALNIVRRYGIELPAATREVLESGRGESVKPGDPRLARATVRTIATPQMALEAAAAVARGGGNRIAYLERRRRRRGTRRGQSPGSYCLASRRARSTGSGTLRLAVGRRDDGDCARQRTRRAKRGISAVPRHCTQWSPAYPWAGGGHGWCRRPRGNCRRTDRTGFDRTRLGPRLSAHGNTGRQRCA